MPPETERLGYAGGIMEQLRASHDQMSKEELLDLVCHLTKTYVLDQTIPFDLPMPERAEEMRRSDPPDVPEGQDDTEETEPAEVRFGRLIQGLKRRTGLPQLECFSLVDGKAVLVVDNQKVTFGERVTVEFLPRAGRPGGELPAPAPTPGAPGAPAAPNPGPASRPTPGAPAAREPAPRKQPTATSPPQNKPAQPANDDDDDDDGVERFRRLDLD